MVRKINFILMGIILSGAAVIIYMFPLNRIKDIEELHIENILHTTDDVGKLYTQFTKEEKAADSDSAEGRTGEAPQKDLAELINTINSHYKDIALLIIADPSRTIRISSKNDRYIPTPELYDSLINDFKEDVINYPYDKGYTDRYYEIKEGNKVKQYKFYIVRRHLPGAILTFFYPYTPDKKIITRIAIEAGLIVLAIVILTTILYIATGKKEEKGDTLTKKEKKKAKSTREKSTSQVQKDIIIDHEKRSLSRDESPATKSFRSPSTDSLNSFTYDIFKKIYTAYHPDSISLFTFTPPDILLKQYELRGKSFIKIDSKTFDNITLEQELKKELMKSSAILMEQGKKIILPLLYNNSLLGTIHLLRGTSFNSTEIQDIKQTVSAILKELSDYLVVNNVMVDNKTGLFSKTYCNIRINEMLKSRTGETGDFSLIIISLLENADIFDEKYIFKTIKFITPSIIEVLPQEYILCCDGTHIVAMIPNQGKEKTLDQASNLYNKLSKFRIKFDSETILTITPHIGVSSTEGCENPERIMDMAYTALHQSLTDNAEDIQFRS